MILWAENWPKSNNVKRVARVVSLSVLVETSFDGKVGGHWSMVGGGRWAGTHIGVLTVGRFGLQRETWQASFLQQYAAPAMPHIYPPLCLSLCYLSFSLLFVFVFVICLSLCYLSFSLLYVFVFVIGRLACW